MSGAHRDLGSTTVTVWKNISRMEQHKFKRPMESCPRGIVPSHMECQSTWDKVLFSWGRRDDSVVLLVVMGSNPSNHMVMGSNPSNHMVMGSNPSNHMVAHNHLQWDPMRSSDLY